MPGSFFSPPLKYLALLSRIHQCFLFPQVGCSLLCAQKQIKPQMSFLVTPVTERFRITSKRDPSFLLTGPGLKGLQSLCHSYWFIVKLGVVGKVVSRGLGNRWWASL